LQFSVTIVVIVSPPCLAPRQPIGVHDAPPVLRGGTCGYGINRGGRASD
jgi:hypothetical protein